MKKNNKGFSLVELIVVIAIMAILAAIAIPTFAHFIKKANQASDDELLHNINYIFSAACLENGVEVTDVKNAIIRYSEDADMEMTSVVMEDGDTALATKIMNSFNLHFGDMKKEKFKTIENISFKRSEHAFVAGGQVFSYVTEDGRTYYYEADPNKAAAFAKSAFMNEMGIETTLGIMDKVGAFAQNFLVTDNSTALNTVLQSVEFVQAFARYVSYPYEVTGTSDVEPFYTWLRSQYTEDEQAKVTSNALMLYSSEKSGELTNESVKDLLGDANSSAKDQILANLQGTNPSTATAMAQTAAAYSLYTAYLYSLPDGYVDDATQKTKSQLIADAEANPISVLNGLDDAGFQAYINNPDNSDDIDGYLAAMGMMNEASGTSNGKGGTAAGDILTEGFKTDWMQGMLGQTNDD